MLKKNCHLAVGLLIIGIIYPGLSQGEEQQHLDQKARKKVHYVLTIGLQEGLEKTISEPIAIIREKILTSIEKKNGIKIDRPSMVRTDKCLSDILTSIPHLAKISAGNRLIRAEFELNADTSQKSVWTKWQTRKLEHPELKITFFYANKAVEPTEIFCSGYKYH